MPTLKFRRAGSEGSRQGGAYRAGALSVAGGKMLRPVVSLALLPGFELLSIGGTQKTKHKNFIFNIRYFILSETIRAHSLEEKR